MSGKEEMAHKDYNIELTEEEVQGLDNIFDSPDAEGATTESESAKETVQSVEQTTTEETPKESTEESEDSKEVIETEVVDGFEIDGTRYTLEDAKIWREDSENKSSWQKSNTEKAQSLSKWGKLGKKINDDSEFREHLKDYFFDDPEAVKALGLDKEIDIPESKPRVEEKVVPEINPEINERLKTLESIEGERVMEARVDKLDQQLNTLEEKFPEYLEGEKSAEFLEYAEKHAHKFVENGLPDLDRAFREWSYAEMQAELDHYKKLGQNKARNEGKIINTSEVGAKEVKTPKKIGWDDMTMNNPDIAEYFNEK